MSSERKKYFSLAYDAERARSIKRKAISQNIPCAHILTEKPGSINKKPLHKIFYVYIFLNKRSHYVKEKFPKNIYDVILCFQLHY